MGYSTQLSNVHLVVPVTQSHSIWVGPMKHKYTCTKVFSFSNTNNYIGKEWRDSTVWRERVSKQNILIFLFEFELRCKKENIIIDRTYVTKRRMDKTFYKGNLTMNTSGIETRESDLSIYSNY